MPAGTFGASQQLLESVTGSARTAPVAASFLAAETSYLLTSAADGSAAVRLTFPADATGSYGITLAQQGDGRTAFGSVTVLEASDPRCDPSVDPAAAAPVDPPAAATDPAPASARTAEQLPHTGTRISAGVVGGAAGAVVLGAVLSFVVGRRRRLRHR
ncbi:MAG TPA: LPXTG cell wall anchor domain-containing protein [Gryllotalpicola sp.]